MDKFSSIIFIGPSWTTYGSTIMPGTTRTAPIPLRWLPSGITYVVQYPFLSRRSGFVHCHHQDGGCRKGYWCTVVPMVRVAAPAPNTCEINAPATTTTTSNSGWWQEVKGMPALDNSCRQEEYDGTYGQVEGHLSNRLRNKLFGCRCSSGGPVLPTYHELIDGSKRRWWHFIMMHDAWSMKHELEARNGLIFDFFERLIRFDL